ncbi:MAG: outer membrane beta-barrel family protein [Bacteroidales bacterium]
MKRIHRLSKSSKKVLTVLLLLTGIISMYAQEKMFIEGIVADGETANPIPYANIVLYAESDSSLIGGVNTTEKGLFEIDVERPGIYRLIISYVGYGEKSKVLSIAKTQGVKLDTVFLEQKAIGVGEAKVVYERVKAQKSNGKLVYFVNNKLLESSDTGMDIIKHLPGVQVDLMQNISFEGNKDLTLMVNGHERDKDFLNQLDSRQIDKIELLASPGAAYDADSRGLINIILKKDRKSGFSGHVFAEIPGSESNIYVSPSASLNYNHKGLNIYSSYSSGLSYFDINESIHREISIDERDEEIFSDQYVRQKSWSHRFQLGMDLLAGEKDRLGIFFYYQPFSTEFDGDYKVLIKNAEAKESEWSALKEETDKNHTAFYSLYYKHNFGEHEHKIVIDASFMDYRGVNRTSYTGIDRDGLLFDQLNEIRPAQYSGSIKADYSNPVSEDISFQTGFKSEFRLLSDRMTYRYSYKENLFAAYGSFRMDFRDFEIKAGLRLEYSKSARETDMNPFEFSFLPGAEIAYKLNEKQDLSFSYRRSLSRPGISRLNPYMSMNGPMSLTGGNPDLNKELINDFNIDYSRTIGKSYLSAGIFCKGVQDAINQITYINSDNLFESKFYNMGNIITYGIKYSSSLKLGENISLNSYLRLFGISTRGNELAEEYNIKDKNKIAFESGLSAILSLNYGFSAGLDFQYNSPVYEIQKKNFSDALYFVNINKEFSKKLKTGIKFALPFRSSFIYSGSSMENNNFSGNYEGKIQIRGLAVMLNLKYRFNYGQKTVNTRNRNTDNIDIQKRGF